jgi:hypothetical protein
LRAPCALIALEVAAIATRARAIRRKAASTEHVMVVKVGRVGPIGASHSDRGRSPNESFERAARDSQGEGSQARVSPSWGPASRKWETDEGDDGDLSHTGTRALAKAATDGVLLPDRVPSPGSRSPPVTSRLDQPSLARDDVAHPLIPSSVSPSVLDGGLAVSGRCREIERPGRGRICVLLE